MPPKPNSVAAASAVSKRSYAMMLDRGVMKQFKLCVQCQLPMTRRKKWASDVVWDEVRYCSDRCRKAAKK
ncbi:hypothetical protein BJ741DRAFT_615120 [Chytriomyces cf. hyalinus JEL632]|nr:hypothetical protein BJ741DRAFT_615120 [Chytriomyces cf. hyalinus JEL632]